MIMAKSIEKLILSKYSRVHYIGKCIKKVREQEFVDFVLTADKDFNLIQFSQNGEENKNINIMIIHNVNSLNGFFAEFRCTLKLLAYAERYDFVPYVIYDNTYLYFEKDGVNNCYNPFEYYFEQVTDIPYNSIAKSYNIFDAKPVHSYMIDVKHGMSPGSYVTTMEYLEELALIMRKYIRLNNSTDEYVRNSIQGLLLSDERVLGVHHRGTDYKKAYKGHPKCVTIEEKIQLVKTVIDRYDKIFIATDEQEAIEMFLDNFGDKVCYYKDVYRGTSDISVAFSKSDRQLHKYHLGLEVLRDMYTLARCDGLIAGMSQVSLCAQITKISEGKSYDYLNIVDKGIHEEGAYFKAKV